MLTTRKADERGATNISWLDSRHSFSFGQYQDPAHMGFRSLRVINDDRVAGGGGFAPHGHRDMEIISYVVDGSLAHEDSTGAGSAITPGYIQRMSAGSGVRHSEFNGSQTDPVRFLQVWIEPEAGGLEPRYDEAHFEEASRNNALKLLASRAGREDSLAIYQDADMYAGLIGDDAEVPHAFAQGRYGWVQVVKGSLTVTSASGETVNLTEGDGLAIKDEESIKLSSDSNAEVLVFDLA